MISREEQHAFEIEYKSIGNITATDEKHVNVEIFEGMDKKTFNNEADAIAFVKRKTMVFQKNKQIGLSVRFNKANGKVTHLLFPNSKTVNPFEVSTFYWNQIQTNVDPKNRAGRIDQLVPIKVSFNDIARVSAYTGPRKVRNLGIITGIASIALIIYALISCIFMLAPSDSSKVLSIATGLPYKSAGAVGTGLVTAFLAIAAASFLFYPYYSYYRTAKDTSGGYSYAGKSWKANYLARIRGNWIAMTLIALAAIFAIMNNYFVSGTIFFTSEIHSSRTWMMVIFLALTDTSIIFLVAVVTWQLVTTFKRTRDYLSAHVDPRDKDLFKSWTTHKRIESKEYIYDYLENFTFPPTMERLRIISEEIYPKKLRKTDKTKQAIANDLKDRYNAGFEIYKANRKAFSKKQGI